MPLEIRTTTLAAVNNSVGLTDIATTDVPPGMIVPDGASPGVLRAALNVASSFRVAPTSGAGSPFNVGNDYWIRFWVRFVETTPPMPADNTLVTVQMMNLASVIFYTLANRNNGFWYELRQFVSGTNGPAADGGYVYTHQPNAWVEMSLHVKNTTTGIGELYLNRKRMSAVSGNLTTTGTNWNMILPAVASGYWEVGRVCETWSGTDIPMANTYEVSGKPFSFEPADSQVGVAMLASNPGVDYTTTVLAGSPTVTITPAATSGVNPLVNYLRIAGAATGSMRVDMNPVGKLKTKNGWGHIHFPQLYLPSGATATIAIRNAADTRDLINLTLGGGNVMRDGVVMTPFPAATRNSLTLLLSTSTDARILVTNQTTYPALNDLIAWGEDLGDWSPQDIGKVTITVTLGSASCDLTTYWSGSVLSLYGMDSQSAANASLSNPEYNVPNNMAAGFCFPSEALAIPGATGSVAANPNYRRRVGLVVGRSGMKMSEWMASVFPALAKLPGGVELILMDGGGLNDVTLATDEATAITVAKSIDAMDAQIEAWATKITPGGTSLDEGRTMTTPPAPTRKLVTATMVERTLQGHWAGAPAANIVRARTLCIRELNELRRARFAKHPSPAIVFCDVTGTMTAAEQSAAVELANPPHLSLAGNARAALAMHGAEKSAEDSI
jgi:hypothetical protein